MKKIQLQQGDLILRCCESVVGPKHTAKKFTLLKGEGVNTHDVTGDFTTCEVDGILYLTVGDSGATLTHSEHGTETIAPGTYERVIEREFDYEEMESRNVRD